MTPVSLATSPIRHSTGSAGILVAFADMVPSPTHYTRAGSLADSGFVSVLFEFSFSMLDRDAIETADASGMSLPLLQEATAARRLATMAKSKAAWSPDLNGSRNQGREEAPAGQGRLLGLRELGQNVRADEVLDRVVAEERCEERRDRRKLRYLVRCSIRHAVRHQPVVEALGQRRGEARNDEREEDPDRQDLSGVLEGGVHARSDAAVLGRKAAHDRRTVG